MSFAPGTRLGPYEIVSALGAGGMGEVYRATDTKLKRQVAIKIPPAALAADQSRGGQRRWGEDRDDRPLRSPGLEGLKPGY